MERSSLAKPDLKAATETDSVREAGSEFHSSTVLMVKKVLQFSGGGSWVLEFVSVLRTDTKIGFSQPKGVGRNVNVAVNYFEKGG